MQRMIFISFRIALTRETRRTSSLWHRFAGWGADDSIRNEVDTDNDCDIGMHGGRKRAGFLMKPAAISRVSFIPQSPGMDSIYPE